MDVLNRVPVREQDPAERAHNFDEVCLGYSLEEAKAEADRCLKCKNPKCQTGCPVNIDIPRFIGKIGEGDIEGAYHVISEYSGITPLYFLHRLSEITCPLPPTSVCTAPAYTPWPYSWGSAWYWHSGGMP